MSAGVPVSIDFVALTEVPLASVVELLNEPRNARHLPLAGTFTEESAADWVRDKDGQWQRHGYGPWAVLVAGEFAGWGGFQHEDNGADFALVLRPEHWGLGADITRAALHRGFGELGLDEVVIALPYTRRPDRAVARFGFVPDGEVSYHGVRFRQYRLTRDAWSSVTAAERPSARAGYAEPEPAAAEMPLLGGDVSVGVVRVGDTVRRPLGPNSPVIHAVLRHLERVGFAGAPRFLGVDAKDREVLSFVEGEVAGRPRPPWIGDEDRLRSVAQLLRDYHQAMATFVLPDDLVPDWGVPDLPGLPQLTPPQPPELVGHQDITPENVVFADGRAWALIDFDLVRPTSRLMEVVNALIWWAPLADPVDRDPEMVDLDAARRCRIFADAYGLDATARHDLVDVAVSAAARSMVLMKHRAETMGGGWQRMWDEGVGDVISRRRSWLTRERRTVLAALSDPA